LERLTFPPPLRPGATIGVAAVSGPVDPARLARGVSALERRGYRVVLASNVESRRGYLAGSDAARADGYRELVRRSDVDAIFFARGGYGASRILDRLDADEIRARPRIHLGSSDLTALFAYLARRCGLATFYGPMIAVSMADENDDLDWESVVRGATPAPHRFSEEQIVAAGRGEGPLVGGCLSILASLCGTPEAFDAHGAVFFWEDVGEDTYRLDRMLTQLERSGTFDRLQAMVIGSISPGVRGGESPETVAAWLRDYFAGAPFPVVSGFPAGHLARPRTLPLGRVVRVDASTGRLDFPASAEEAKSPCRP